MMILFLNAAFGEHSRTLRLAKHYLERYDQADIVSVEIGELALEPLKRNTLKIYNKAVETADYTDKLFDTAKQFAKADEIVIAAPFWNFGIPAALHTYTELACTQGITFDMTPDGAYRPLCRASKLVYITTAGAYIEGNDHAFIYIKCLCDNFWAIRDIEYYKAEGLDIQGNDIDSLLAEAEKAMDAHK